MERRTLLKTIGGTAAVGTTAFALTHTASAEQPTINFTATSPPTRQFDNGEITAISAYIEDGVITWDGLEHDATGISVSLSVANPDSDGYTELATKTLGVDGQRSKQGSRTFSMGPVDLTSEQSPYTDADFSQDTDGETKTTQVTLRLTATITTTSDGYAPSNTATDPFTVGIENQPDSVSGDVESVSPVSFGGNYYEQNEKTTVIGTPHLRIYYGADNVKLEMDISEFVSDVAAGAPLNSAIGVDVDNDGVAELQLGWLPGLSGEPKFAYKENTGSGWSAWSGLDTISEVTTSEENGVVSFTITRSYMSGQYGVEAGDYVRTGFYGSAGGEEGVVVVSDDNTQFWSSANNYTSSEHFIITQVE